MHLKAIALASLAASSFAAPTSGTNDAVVSSSPPTTETTSSGLLITWKSDGADDLQKRAKTTEVLPSGLTVTWEDKGSIDDTEKRDSGVNLSKLLSKRSSDYISSCGSKNDWIPLQYFGTEIKVTYGME